MVRLRDSSAVISYSVMERAETATVAEHALVAVAYLGPQLVVFGANLAIDDCSPVATAAETVRYAATYTEMCCLHTP